MTTRVRFPLLVLSWVAVAAVSVGVVWLSTFRPLAEPMQEDESDSSYVVVRSEFADERPVEIRVAPEPGSPLIVRDSGVLTAVECVVGGTWSSGSSTVAVDGAALMLLSGEQPWHRDLELGDEGEDVMNLQRALDHLGGEVALSGRYDAATHAAWKKVAAKAQVPVEDGVFRLGEIVWLPEDEVAITECPLTAGQDIADGAAIATAGSGSAAVSFSAPADLFDGVRILTVGATTVELDESLGLVTANDIAAVLSTVEVTAAIAQGEGEAVQVSGALRLASPIAVYAVPPSAVLRDASARVCVLSGGLPVAVEVVSSALGLTYVRLEDDPPTAVDVYPAEDATCGS